MLFIGRLSEEKGIKLLAEALVGTLDDIIVKVAGTGPYYDDIKHIIDNNNLKMELLGHMESGALSNIIASSALIVVPSLCYEGFPMVILDAYSHGKPVLVADIGGLSELVVPGVTGEIFRAGSTAALRRALVDVMSDGEKLRIMGKNAYQRYLVNYSELQNISLLRRMYTEAIEAF